MLKRVVRAVTGVAVAALLGVVATQVHAGPAPRTGAEAAVGPAAPEACGGSPLGCF